MHRLLFSVDALFPRFPLRVPVSKAAQQTHVSQHDREDLVQRLVCFFFGMTVIGQLWIWPLALLLASRSWWLTCALVLYCAYAFGPGAPACENDKWGAPLRRWSLWNHLGRYFQARLIVTTPLDPHGKYLMGCYPHGISAISGWVCLATDAAGVLSKLPGISVWPCTLSSNFRCPGVREFCLLHGLRSCARGACQKLLRKAGTALVLFPGGAAEALITREGCYDVICRKRKGFVRVALDAGASLVPVVCFGETSLFHTWIPDPTSWVAKAQRLSHRLWGTSQPIFEGRGLLADKGKIPLKRPLTMVVGAPIPPPAWQGEAGGAQYMAAMDAFHKQYMDALQQLFTQWVEELHPDRQGDLTYVQ